jgi:hypothetical protein
MLDNNLILLIAIGVVVFLIINLNATKSPTKSAKKSSRQQKLEKYSENTDYNNIENFQSNESQPLYQLTSAPIPDQTQNITQSPNIAPSPAPGYDLNTLYNANLKGSPSPGFDSNITNIGNAANYGQGYSLGIDNSDPRLSKFTSQGPVQKTQLISDDLLPKKTENWFENPSIGTKIDDANLLADAIFKTGVDTIGSTRKNPSYDMRGNIPNPKFPISPWMNSSYEPDNNLRGLCI